MATTPERSRVYLVYQHGLFAEGIRSLLQNQPAIEIVGSERDKTKALRALRSLKPSVVLVEESSQAQSPSTAWTLWRLLFTQNRACRVVALNLGHNAATVYDRESYPILTPEDLVEALHGCPQPPIPVVPTARVGCCATGQKAPKAKPPIAKRKPETPKGRA